MGELWCADTDFAGQCQSESFPTFDVDVAVFRVWQLGNRQVSGLRDDVRFGTRSARASSNVREIRQIFVTGNLVLIAPGDR
jgi:hypothetical protein